MEKFIKFIKFYHLNGLIERVEINNDSGTVSTLFSLENRTLAGKIVGKNILPTVEDFNISLDESDVLLKKLIKTENPHISFTKNMLNENHEIVTKKNGSGRGLRTRLFNGTVIKPNSNTIQGILSTPILYEITIDDIFKEELKSEIDTIKCEVLTFDTDNHLCVLNSTNGKHISDFKIDNNNHIGGYGEIKIPLKYFITIMSLISDNFKVTIHGDHQHKAVVIQANVDDFELTYFMPPLKN